MNRLTIRLVLSLIAFTAAIGLSLSFLAVPARGQEPPALLERPTYSTNPNATTTTIRWVWYAQSLEARLAWFEAKLAAATNPPPAPDILTPTLAKLDEIAAFVRASYPATITVVKSPTFTYSWQHPGTGVAAYHVERSFAGGPWQEVAIVPHPTKEWVDSNRPPGRYAYRVRARMISGQFTDYATGFAVIEVVAP